MIRPVKPLVFASVLGLSAVHCGGSTPDSQTPQSQRQVQTGGPDQAGRSDPASAGYQMGSSGASESAGSERMPTAGRDESDTAGGMQGEQAGMALSDAQIAAITQLVHDSEIEQAQLAQSKSKNPAVLNFASLMIRHHTQARQQQSGLGLSSAPSSMSRMMSEQGRQTLATLRDKSGSDFDRAYLQSQIEQHQKVLDSIDQQFLPNAKSPELREHLQELRPQLQQHLEAARDAQRALNTSGQGSSTGSGQGTGTSGSSNRSGSGTTGGAGGR